MNEPISARYDWNPDAFVDAMMAHHRHRKKRLGRFVMGVVAVFYLLLTLGVPLFITLKMDNPPHIKRNGAIVFLIFGAGWLALYQGVRNKTFLRRAARRTFRSLPNQVVPVEWTIDGNQLSNRTALSATTFLWPAFIKVVEAPSGFLMYQNVNFFNYIPGKGFSSEASIRQFAELARSRVAKYVVQGQCQFPAKPKPDGLDEF